MIAIPLKFYAYGAIAIAAVSGALYIKHVFNDRARLEVELKESNITRDTAISSAFLYQENNERQVKLISEYQVKLDEKQAANSVLERDVAANKRRLSIKGANCPASAATANSSATETAAFVTPELRRNIFNLRSGIITLESNYALCLQILNEDRRQKNAQN